MKIKYVGTLPEGILVSTKRRISIQFKKGIPIEVPDEFGESLTKRPSSLWKPSRAEKKKEYTGGGD